MSLYLGTTTLAGIATETKLNAHSLLDFKFTDHILNEMSWLRADTFSWQNGSVYTAVYTHLSTEQLLVSASTETIGSYTITYYQAEDGHKIVLADQADTVDKIYKETGVAWYYIIDTTNTRFKLPRTKYGFSGLRDTVGKFINESLPNITGTFNITHTYSEATNVSGAFYANNVTGTKNGSQANTNGCTISLNASRSSSTYQDGASVQEKSTQMYLYFYVGEFSQSATEQTAGITTETLNNKQDKLTGVSGVGDYVVEWKAPTDTDTTWYRKYKSGWVEQGGIIASKAHSASSSTATTITLLKTMANMSYNVSILLDYGGNYYSHLVPTTLSRTATSFIINTYNNASYTGYSGYMWRVEGMGALS